jgi:hypothetical protein
VIAGLVIVYIYAIFRRAQCALFVLQLQLPNVYTRCDIFMNTLHA